MKKVIIFVLTALSFTGCKSNEAESVLNDVNNPKVIMSFGSNNLSFDEPSIFYQFFNQPYSKYQNSYIAIYSSNMDSDMNISFIADKLTPKVTSAKINGKDLFLGIELKTNFNNIPEVWYNDDNSKTTTDNIEITDFEYRDKGKIRGVINTTMIGQSGTNKGKRINAKIEFVGRYTAS